MNENTPNETITLYKLVDKKLIEVVCTITKSMYAELFTVVDTTSKRIRRVGYITGGVFEAELPNYFDQDTLYAISHETYRIL